MGIPWEEFGSAWIFYAQLAFTAGMLIHAYRTGAESFWYFVIFLLQPIGAWAYFFAVFLRGFSFGRGISTGPLWERKLSLAELRFRVEQAPTVNNRIALAERLMEKGDHPAAIPLLEAVLAVDQIHGGAMHDLALCHLACDKPTDAVAMLERLLQRDPRWAYYRAWPTLIDAHLACGNPSEALKACRQLERMVPTLEHKCLLAEHLLANKLSAEAIHVLDLALEEQSFAPFGKRLKNWRWARRAQQLLKEAETA
jgi:hypothetical protein